MCKRGHTAKLGCPSIASYAEVGLPYPGQGNVLTLHANSTSALERERSGGAAMQPIVGLELSVSMTLK